MSNPIEILSYTEVVGGVLGVVCAFTWSQRARRRNADAQESKHGQLVFPASSFAPRVKEEVKVGDFAGMAK